MLSACTRRSHLVGPLAMGVEQAGFPDGTDPHSGTCHTDQAIGTNPQIQTTGRSCAAWNSFACSLLNFTCGLLTFTCTCVLQAQQVTGPLVPVYRESAPLENTTVTEEMKVNALSHLSPVSPSPACFCHASSAWPVNGDHTAAGLAANCMPCQAVLLHSGLTVEVQWHDSERDMPSTLVQSCTFSAHRT